MASAAGTAAGWHTTVDNADELRLLHHGAQGALLATLVARRPGVATRLPPA